MPTSSARTKLVFAFSSFSSICLLAVSSAIPASAETQEENSLPEHVEQQIAEEELDDSSQILYAPELGEHSPHESWQEIPEGGQLGQEGEVVDPNEASPFYTLPDTLVSNCLSGVTVTLPLQTYSSVHNGQVQLMCGTDGSGLRHISNDHRLDWTAMMGGFSGSWYDYMSFGVDAALQAPSDTRTRTSNNTRCYITPIEVYDTTGSYVRTFYARGVVSINNQLIITAFPQTSTSCPQ